MNRRQPVAPKAQMPASGSGRPRPPASYEEARRPHSFSRQAEWVDTGGTRKGLENYSTEEFIRDSLCKMLSIVQDRAAIKADRLAKLLGYVRPWKRGPPASLRLTLEGWKRTSLPVNKTSHTTLCPLCPVRAVSSLRC